jgi:DNA-binding XRE family transcriptional regulator
MEIWKQVPEYPDYEASSLGNIRSLDKIVPKWNAPFYRKRKGKILKKSIGTNGYYYISMYKDKKQKSFKVARVIAQTFLNNPRNLPEVNHINSNRTDDRVQNLEWCNRSQNMKHAFDKGFACQKGEKNGYSKLSKKEVIEIKRLHSIGDYKQKELAKIFNISKTTIHNVIKGKTWSHLE